MKRVESRSSEVGLPRPCRGYGGRVRRERNRRDHNRAPATLFHGLPSFPDRKLIKSRGCEFAESCVIRRSCPVWHASRSPEAVVLSHRSRFPLGETPTSGRPGHDWTRCGRSSQSDPGKSRVRTVVVTPYYNVLFGVSQTDKIYSPL
jgi:hypothetical protein